MPWSLPSDVTTLCFTFLGYSSVSCASVSRLFQAVADNVEFGTETINVSDPGAIPDKAARKIINMNISRAVYLDEGKFANLRGLRIHLQHWYIDHGFLTDSMYCLGLPHTQHLTSITMVSCVYCNSRTMEEFCLFGSLMPDLKFLTIDAHISHPKSMTLNLAMMPALEELFIAPDSNIHIYDGDVSKILDRVNAPIRFPSGSLPDVTHLVASHAKDTVRWIGDRDYNITVLLRHAPRLQQLDMRRVRMEHLCCAWNREDAEEKARIRDHVRNIGTVAFNSDIEEEHDWWTEFDWQVKHSLFCPPRIRKGHCSFQWRTHDVPDIHG